MPARLSGPGPVSRGTARTGMGRGRGPLHQRGQAHHAPAAGQARQPARHPHRPRGWLPNRRHTMTVITTPAAKRRLRRPPLRVQLTVLYAGLFALLVAVVLAVSGLLV